jgi:hypothetical protein
MISSILARSVRTVTIILLDASAMRATLSLQPITTFTAYVEQL